MDKCVRGIFDKSKFKIYNELSKTRISKEYLHSSYNEKLKEIELNILLKETELGSLLDKRKDIALDAIKEYFKEHRN